MSGGEVYYSGILVRVREPAWEAALEALERIPEVGVHQQERESGRVVVTTETVELDRQIALLSEIREIEGVLLAEPVYAYRDGAAAEPCGPSNTIPSDNPPCSDEREIP